MAESYKLNFIPKQGYLHIVVTGINNRENVASYLKEVYQECKSRKYSRVLIEEHLDGPRLSLLDVFKIASEAENASDGTLRSVAYVDLNAENDSMKFAETVAVNRSMPVSVFSSLEDAEKWLCNKIT